MELPWCEGLSMNEGVWNHVVISKNRERLLAGVIANEFFHVVVEQARSMRLVSDDRGLFRNPKTHG
jgi:hypothetical protein